MVSDTRAVEIGLEPGRINWRDRLSLCLPLVFLIGAPSVIITRLIFLEYYPSHFVNDSPTISETASRAPSSFFFEWTMLAVMLCILVSWSLNLARNKRRLSGLPGGGGPGLALLNWASNLTGIAAGIFLAVVAVNNLVDGHKMHMAGSWAFYISQVLSITLDILFVIWLRRRLGNSAPRDMLWARIAVAVGIFIGSWFFLYMYESKGSAAPDHKYAIQLIYISAEYWVCLLCLIYPLTAYTEMRRDLRAMATAERS